MREILFRGKQKDNGEWVYGYYEKYNGGSYINLQTDRLNSGGYPIREFIEVIPETVGQCTGLTDKNGNKIFEGDIVNYDGHFYSVEFGKHNISCCGCCFDYHSSVGFYLKFNDDTIIADEDTWDDLYIIGNIHDNPELLRKEDDNGQNK